MKKINPEAEFQGLIYFARTPNFIILKLSDPIMNIEVYRTFAIHIIVHNSLEFN